MPATLTKPQILKAVADLPDEATVEDVIERLVFLDRIEQGLGQARRGETVPHAEVVRRMEERFAARREAR